MKTKNLLIGLLTLDLILPLAVQPTLVHAQGTQFNVGVCYYPWYDPHWSGHHYLGHVLTTLLPILTTLII